LRGAAGGFLRRFVGLRLLIADDEESIRWVLTKALEQEGFEIETAANGKAALAAILAGRCDLVILDIRLPDMNGLDILSQAKQRGAEVTVIVVTAQATMTNAIEAMKRGAFNYLTKPFDLEAVRAVVHRAAAAHRETLRLRQELAKRYRLPLAEEERGEGAGVVLVGRSAPMQEIFKTIGRVAQSDATVLIEGESGTGKELVARLIHFHSSRWRGPFVAINCSAIPRELLENELFGHERGSFTGALERRAGKFEAAAGGTLFFDEVGDMPQELQSKVLRVLQEREFVRLGGNEPVRADVRVIAATNQDLTQAVREKRFREDLYFRLRVVPIVVPPLRQRRADIPELCRHFLEKFEREMNLEPKKLSSAALAMLARYDWPGNVRELENCLLRAAVVSPGQTIDAEDIALSSGQDRPLPGDSRLEELIRLRIKDLVRAGGGNLYHRAYALLEKPLLEAALEACGGNQTKAADMLGINRNTLRKKLSALHLAGCGNSRSQEG